MVFTVIVCFLPLAIDAALLVLFRPWYVVLWYFALVGSFAAVTVGLIGRFTAGAGQFAASESTSQALITFGAAVCGFCLLLLFIRWVHHRCTRRSRSDNDDVGEDEFNYVLRFHRRRALVQLIVAVVFIVGGLVLVGVINISPPNTRSSAEALSGPVPEVFGAIAIAIGGLAVLFFIMNLFEGGRRAIAYLQAFLDRNLLLILLIMISASFMPVLSQCIDAVLCTEFKCPAGTRFNPFIPEPLTRLTPDDAATYCEVCDFNTTTSWSGMTCTADNATELCPEWSGHRLWRHLDTACNDESSTYFYITAGLVGIAYAVGIPVLVYNVVSRVTAFVARFAKIVDQENEHPDERWGRKMLSIDPSVSGLYRPLRWGLRQYTVVDYVTRIIFVVIAHVVAPLYTATASYIILGLHTILAFALIVYRPYRHLALGVIVFAMTLCNVLTALLAVLLTTNAISAVKDNGKGFATAVLVIDSVVPIAGAIFLAYAELRFLRRPPEEGEEEENRDRGCCCCCGGGDDGDDEGRVSYLDSAMAKARERQDQKALDAAERDLDGTTTVGDNESRSASLQGSPVALALAPPSTQTPPASPGSPVPHSAPATATVTVDDEPSPDLGATLRGANRREAIAAARAEGDLDAASAASPVSGVAIAAATTSTREPFSKGKKPLTLAQQQLRVRNRKNRLRTYLVERRVALLLNVGFMALGVILAIATTIAVLGLLREPASPFQYGSASYSQGYSVALAGYSSWDDFTDACCCAPSELPLYVDGLNTTETWVCRNGRSVLRARSASDGSSSGLPLRGLCEVNFTAGCGIVLDDTTVRLSCDAGVVDALNMDNATHGTVTAYAQAVLW
jgi:hypothetical protein